MRTNSAGPASPAWHRWVARDRSWSQALHQAMARRAVVPVLVVVSWLSDGPLWYGTMLALPWFGGPNGTACALRMFCLGAVNLVIYKVLKRYFARPRPFVDCPGIRACARSLDEYSFPSGHALYAVGFSTLLEAYYAGLGWIVWPLTTLIALSRVVLGLHYPSDVVVGAAIGWVLAQSVLVLF